MTGEDMKDLLAGKAFESTKGFTLIELMITVVIVILALVGYVQANMAVGQAGNVAFERSLALQDANRVAEQMRTASQTGNFPANVVASFPSTGAVAGFTNLTSQQVTVTYADSAADPLDATILVSWQENGRRLETTALRILLTQREAAT